MSFLKFAPLCVLALGGCGGVAGPAVRSPRPDGPTHLLYAVRVDPDVTYLDVRACFRGGAPRRLWTNVTGVGAAVRDVRLERSSGMTNPLRRRGESVELPHGTARDGCVVYRVGLPDAVETLMRGGRRYGTSLITNGASWLLRPEPLREDLHIEVAFELPDGVEAAAPWRKQGGAFHVDVGVYRFLSHVVFGRFTRHALSVAGCAVEVVRLEGALAASDDDLLMWLRGAAETAAQLFGRFPARRALVIVVPTRSGSAPVAFGNVGRGGGGSVMFLVRAQATLPALRGEWVAPHEFSHLAVPYVTRRDLWLSEGLATYYQEVLRARSGVHSELEAWRAIDEGFRRGTRSGTGRSLRQESRDVFETHAFSRVYWAGTALALLSDVALRRRGSSLDEALGYVAQHQQTRPNRPWTGEELVAAIDRAAGVPLMAREVRQHLDAQEFPELSGVYRYLGVVRDARSRLVSLDNSAAGAEVRRAIMQSR